MRKRVSVWDRFGQLAFGYVEEYGRSGLVYNGYPGVGGLTLSGTFASLFLFLLIYGMA
jgi:hypothetical protein